MRPDPGRDLLDARVAAVAPADRLALAARLRESGMLVAWGASDTAGPKTELERAFFLLDRLYPEMPPQHREQFRAQLEAGWQAGTWTGFRRPSPLPADGA